MYPVGGEVRTGMALEGLSRELERLYVHYNSPVWIHPDPLEFLHYYKDIRDREIVGIIASSLAYGRVAQILASVEKVLSLLGPSPYGFLLSANTKSIREGLKGFKHRFTTEEEMTGLLLGIKGVIEAYGSLEACFYKGLAAGPEPACAGLCFLVERLLGGSPIICNSLLPHPSRGSACKRLNLFLRWMVRQDEVDPGGWNALSPAELLVPLDTHMHRICMHLGLTARKDASLATAREITNAFKQIAPHDPIRYDFALTRLGIRRDSDPEGFFRRLEEVLK
jgi:uncharacterized protein (TIGR02757 family)